ncbi:polyketide cyclase [Streptomyces viridiviolaceus]|nr:polyketide cyclase [Streptomyces viridiviolaceus]
MTGAGVGTLPHVDWNHYRFRSLWTLPAPVPAVYRALERIEDYPRWWPQVREVTRLDDTSGIVRIRSLVPYDLTCTLRERARDPAAGILEVSLSGDIDGWARWTITARGTGALARYDQEVDVRKPLLRRLALPGRPVFRANHTLMMRAGRRGLGTRLEAV